MGLGMDADPNLLAMWRRVDELSAKLSPRDRQSVRDTTANSALEGHQPTTDGIALLIEFAARGDCAAQPLAMRTRLVSSLRCGVGCPSMAAYRSVGHAAWRVTGNARMCLGDGQMSRDTPRVLLPQRVLAAANPLGLVGADLHHRFYAQAKIRGARGL
jgi:hypothetical protein